MTKSFEFESMDLIPLREVEQAHVNGGAAFLAGLVIVAPLVGIYVGLLGIAYYAGYGAHALYDAINSNK